MSRTALIALVLVVAAGVYVSLLRQNPLLSLLLGVLVGGIIVVIQARREKP